MKKLLILAAVLTLFGCASPPKKGVDFFYGGDNGPKLERDYAECQYEVSKHSNLTAATNPAGGALLGLQMRAIMDQCMSLRGYTRK